MRHRILLVAAMIASLCGAKAANISGDWKVYPSFDADILKIVDAKDRVYVQVPGQRHIPTADEYATLSPFLFVYDKGAEEFLSYTNRNYLSETLVNRMDYNPREGYLLLVYNNSNIDLLYDDDNVVNIPGLKSATLAGSKAVNGVSFDYDNGKAYLATDFGYLVIDSGRKEISESHIYNTAVESLARVGNYLVASVGGKLYISPLSANHLSLDSFVQVPDFSGVSHILPIDSDKFIYLKNKIVYSAQVNADGSVSAPVVVAAGDASNVVANRDGYLFCGGNYAVSVDMQGNARMIPLPATEQGDKVASWDMQEFWMAEPRKGLVSKKLADNSWTVTRDYFRPNAPAAFLSNYMCYNPKYGMMVINHGVKRPFTSNTLRYPSLLSGLDNGQWSVYAPVYADDKYSVVGTDPNGLSVDPDDPRYMYSGSYFGGIIRYDLEDPANYIAMSHPADKGADFPGFVQVVGDNPTWKDYCNFATPRFDADGNLWALFDNTQNTAGFERIWVLPAAERKNGNFQGWKHYNITNFTSNNSQTILPLTHANNRNLMVITVGAWDSPIWVVDNKGTVETVSDDTAVQLGQIYDQDGASVTKNYTYSSFEDPSTGNVWICTFNGVFYFNPQTALTDPSRVTRIKVARNDGTNLADYLLDNVGVFQMTADAQNRKWFATKGGGLVCTTADGKEVLAEYTTENSYLPSNTVYSVAYNPQTNSIIVSTDAGYAEFFPTGSSTGDDLDSVRAYPNPVRPDFLGWVTVDGLLDGSLVKIADSQGNIVKELGLSQGGEVQWDLTTLEGKSAVSGVYYVLASSGPGDTKLSKVTKILVVR